MNNATDHAWHVWINSEQSNKYTQLPIQPHERGLYSFKGAMQTLPWLKEAIGRERRKELPMVHQQCSHSKPEAMEENHLACWLGQRLDKCPILERLKASFRETMERPYYRQDIRPEDIDEAMAMTCIWHMLMCTDAYVDWNEGAVQDSSDRRFWSNVYDSLARGMEADNPP